MEKVIYKYPLEVKRYQEIELPYEAEILTVQNQKGIPVIWALVDPDAKSREKKKIVTLGTGHKINLDKGFWFYIGTYQIAGGDLVFHVFELQTDDESD